MEPDDGQTPEKLFTAENIVLAGLVVLALLAALGVLALPLINWYTDVRGTASGTPGDTHSALNPRGFTEKCQQLRNRAGHASSEVYETLGPESDDDVTDFEFRIWDEQDCSYYPPDDMKN